MRQSGLATRRRRWPIVLPFALVVMLAALWSGAWFYIAGQAKDAIAAWRAREARAGRVYGCGGQMIAGFPFRIEVQCEGPSAELPRMAPPLALKAADALFAWQVYQPALVIAEFSGPLTLGEMGQPASLVARWRLAQASAHLSLEGAERVSIVAEAPSLARLEAGGNTELVTAHYLELHSRRNAGSTPDNLAVDLALQLTGASAPALHPILAQPLDANATGVLRGAVDPTPKPLPVLLREWQARGGSLEITSARVQQGDVIAVGAGTLSLTPRGGLSGQMQITVVELAKVLQPLGIDRIVSQGDVGSAINALDRMLPGLGAIARQNAAPSIVAGLGAIGKNTMLEGKPAVSVPLRFDDGEVSLGPFRVGRVPLLF
jgi:hypothetical protein